MVSHQTVYLVADGMRMEGTSTVTIFRSDQNVLYDMTPARQRYTRVTPEKLQQAASDFDGARRDWAKAQGDAGGATPPDGGGIRPRDRKQQVVARLCPTEESIRISGVLCCLGLSGLSSIIVGETGIPFLEKRAERAIERAGSGLQQQVGPALRPLHLLTFAEALADDGVHR